MLESAVGVAKSPAAAQIGSLTWMLVALGAAVFLVFAVIFVRALMRDRQPEGADTGAKLIFWGGVAMPTVVITVVLGLTLGTMRNLSAEAEEGAIVVEVTGHQWWWDVYYPEYGIRIANEMHIPIDRQVDLRLTSADVIHSFWVPGLAGKLDLLPEKSNEMVLEASEPDVYRGVCAEFCGLQHANMAFYVVAVTEPEFEDWVDHATGMTDQPTTGLAARGMDVFFQAECHECHTIAGTSAHGRVGPDLTHVASRQSLAAGSLDNTPENLADWITNPQTLKPGVKMPDLELSRADIEALVAYLETLE